MNLTAILQDALDNNLINSISSKSGIDGNNIQSMIMELAPKFLNGAKQNLASTNYS